MGSRSHVEVLRIVLKEVVSIRKRDGELSPLPYLVIEIANRLKNLTEWEGYDPGKSHTQNIRNLVEELRSYDFRLPKQSDTKTVDQSVEWVDWSSRKDVYEHTGPHVCIVRHEKFRKKLAKAS